MNLYQFLLRHPRAVITLFSLFTLLGILLLFSIPMDLYPEFNPPVLTVMTLYPQAVPEEILDQITKPLEESLGSISGLEKMSSFSGESVSRIVLEFKWGLSMIPIENDIRSRLGELERELPSDAEQPVLYKFDMNDEPVVELALKAGDDASLRDIYTLAEKSIKSSFEQLEGVAAAELKGLRDETVEIAVFRNRLEAFSLNLTMLAAILKGQNRKLGTGSLDESGLEYSIQADGEFSSLEDIERTVVNNSGGAPVRIRDLGIVRKTLEDPDDSVSLNGDPAIRISILKQSDAHVVKTTDLVLSKVREINKSLPDGFELLVISESTNLIRLVISTIMTSGMIGGLLAMSVIFFFLHKIKPTMIILLSIPVSLLIAVGGLAVLGRTLNILTMGGLILGLGMIVDGSIVVLENIMAYYEKGTPLSSAAMQGTREMASPIAGSTLTSICVFLPLLFMGDGLDILGVLFKDMALSVILALLASLAVSLILVPVLCQILLKKHKPAQKGPVSGLIERFITILERFYTLLLKKSLRNRGTVMLTALILLGSSFLLYPRLGWQFLPVTGEESFILDADFPMGSSLERTVSGLEEVSRMMAGEFPWMEGLLLTAEAGSGRLKGVLPPLDERPLTYEEMKTRVRENLKKWPDVEFEFISTDMAAQMGNTGKLILRIRGTSLDDMNAAEASVLKIIGSRDDILEVLSDREKSRPEVSVSFIRDRAFQLGISMEQGGAEIRAALSGLRATGYREDGETLDVILRLREEDRTVRQDLSRIFLMSSQGVRIPLSNAAVLTEGWIPGGIRRENQMNTIEITAYPDPRQAVNSVQAGLEEQILNEVDLPEGIRIDFGGESEDVEQYGFSLVLIFSLSVLLVFSVMVCQFESLKRPFIIILVLPYMFIGIILCFLTMRLPVNMITIIGSVMLSGIVVNNGIVLVDYTQLLIHRGVSLQQACVEAGRSRLRPVLMTTATTVLAMVPMGFFPGKGGALLQPLGLTIAGGLAVSTLATLFLIPILFFQFHKVHGKNWEPASIL